MCGLPHVHGVSWLNPEKIKNCLDDNGLFREDKDGENNLTNLIDEWIKCTLEFGHVDQKDHIKNLSGEIEDMEKHQETLLAEINKINKDIKIIEDEKAAQTEKLKDKVLNAQMNVLKEEKKAKVIDYKENKTKIQSILGDI